MQVHSTCPLLQQPEVRRAIYDGMPALLAADPSVQVRCRGRGERVQRLPGLRVCGTDAATA